MIAAIITILIDTTIAMSNMSNSSGSKIEEAARTHTYLFIAYILFLALTVLFSILVWKANNKYQKIVKLDADAKIATANATAETAKENASKAEQQNLILRGEVAKLEIKAADAQRSLLELQERLKPRHLTEEQVKHLAATLKDKSPGDVWLFCKSGDEEACNLGQQIFKVLKLAGWNIVNDTLHDLTIHTENVSSVVGVVITVKDLKDVPIGITVLHEVILQYGFDSRIQTKSTLPAHMPEIWVGAKPQVR